MRVFKKMMFSAAAHASGPLRIVHAQNHNACTRLGLPIATHVRRLPLIMDAARVAAAAFHSAPVTQRSFGWNSDDGDVGSGGDRRRAGSWGGSSSPSPPMNTVSYFPHVHPVLGLYPCG
jgi:hypothetical protein